MAAPRLRSIPLAQLVEPERAARTTIDEGGLDSLAASIKATGLIEPLVVRPRGEDRFEIIAGHRRYLALRRLNAVTADCIVRSGDDLVDAVRIHENIERAELAPADEGVYYAALYEELGQDVDRVAERVRKSRDYVERRILLLSTWPAVLAALRDGRISLGVAEELGKLTREEDAAYYVDAASRAGCSVRQARVWREQGNSRAAMMAAAAESEDPGAPGIDAPAPTSGPSYLSMAKPHELSAKGDIRECLFCGVEREEFKMFVKYVCVPCADTHLVRALQEADAAKATRKE